MRIIKIFLLAVLSALIPFLILAYLWGGCKNVSLSVIAVIFAINTIPVILINILYHKFVHVKEMLSSFYFYITFFLSFLIITIYGIKHLNGNYFDYLEGFILLFMLAESMAVFIYITYIFIKYIKEKYELSLLEKIAYLITGMLFANFIILFTAFSSALVLYMFEQLLSLHFIYT